MKCADKCEIKENHCSIVFQCYYYYADCAYFEPTTDNKTLCKYCESNKCFSSVAQINRMMETLKEMGFKGEIK